METLAGLDDADATDEEKRDSFCRAKRFKEVSCYALLRLDSFLVNLLLFCLLFLFFYSVLSGP